MKLLTLNTHSLAEEHYEQKLDAFVEEILKERPDVISLQEVNQTIRGASVPTEALGDYTACQSSVPIRRDNHAYRAARMLAARGIPYHWTWLPVKKGYGVYDEGLALMSLSPILESNVLTVSQSGDYNNWKTRKILGIRPQAQGNEWFFSVHYGWWHDPEEPFSGQFEKTAAHLKNLESVWLMGDFNNPAEIRGEGYDLMLKSGWFDSYAMAAEKDNGITVSKGIDGWRGKPFPADGMRIDQIWHNQKINIQYTRVVFDGVHSPTVSDHCGVIVEYERSFRES